ncbi:MAG: twin-arginine translocase TatA/TatE family subunit [Eggerthellaceae bacterium]
MPFLPKGWEIIVILIVVLILFGPKNLPKLGAALGKGVKNLRDGMGVGKKEKKAQAQDAPAEPKEPVAQIEAEAEVVAEETVSEEAAEAPKKKVVKKVVVKKAE